MRLQTGQIDIGISKNHTIKALDRVTVTACGDTTVDEPLVINIFVGHIKTGRLRQQHPQRRIETDSLTIKMIPMVIQPLGHRVYSEGYAVTQADIEVPLQTTRAK